MKKLAMTVVCAGTMALIVGCSRDSREAAIEKASKAAHELNGTGSDVRDENGEKLPSVVVAERRKEAARQNTQWTAENQAAHPIEYCQAKLSDVLDYAKKMDVRAHEIAVAQNAEKRKSAAAKGQVESLGKFLEETKRAYRDAEAENSWPITINGYSLDREKAQKTIVETSQRLDKAKNEMAVFGNNLRKLAEKQRQVFAEQKRVADLKAKIESTISDLKVKKMIDGEKNIADALSAISDSVLALGGDSQEPTLDDLLAPDEGKARLEAFEEIMSK